MKRRNGISTLRRGWDFKGVEQRTAAAWKKHLNRIEIQGGTPDERRAFYSALYHASLAPRIASDADGTYNGFAGQGKLHKVAGGAYYADFSVWDTFRALHPLFTIIDPDRDQEMIQSLVLKGEQGDFLPSFPLWNSYTAEMVGDHTVSVMTDAYVKGLTHFDVAEAYRLVLKSATVTPPLEEYKLGRGRRALQSYLNMASSRWMTRCVTPITPTNRSPAHSSMLTTTFWWACWQSGWKDRRCGGHAEKVRVLAQRDRS